MISRSRDVQNRTLNSDVFVYFANVENFKLEKVQNLLPDFRLEKIQKLSLEKDKKLSAAAYFLLERALKKHKINIKNFKWEETKNGKPFLSDCPLKFSLSHSGNYVAVALSKNEVGIDVQEMKEVDPKITNLVFNEDDHRFYNDSNDKLHAFYKIWTCKEALIKMSDDGLAKPLKQVNIDSKLVKNLDIIQNYEIAVASPNIKIKKIKQVKNL